MKEHIDTIPLWEAFRENCECPLCRLHSLNETNYREYFMGASLMEPDVRVETNKKGFCGKHYQKMFPRKNRLGMALTLESHLDELKKDLKPGGFLAKDPAEKGVKRIEELGLKAEDYGFYLDLRKYGSARHAGFGLGFERCVMYLTGMANIRDVLPFPRTVNNCEL